jgi:F0F1-type ATP synthase delta subunit
VPVERETDIFSLQEQVIASIVQSSVEQIAVEEAPKVLDPIQQTIATTLRGYINNPAISRNEIKTAIQKVIEPQPGVYIKTLRKAYEQFLTNRNIDELLTAIKSITSEQNTPHDASIQVGENAMKSPVKREDLKLVCFDYVW